MSSIFWEKYSRISGKKQELLSVVSKTALSVWRKSLREHISDFFLFLSRVSELDTSSEEKIFKEKYIAWVKSLYLPFYVSLTELHLRVQRNVSFRSTLLELFPSVHDFETNVIGFGKTFPNFVFENALYVTTRSSKSMFIFWKNNRFVNHSRFVSKNVRFFD